MYGYVSLLWEMYQSYVNFVAALANYVLCTETEKSPLPHLVTALYFIPQLLQQTTIFTSYPYLLRSPTISNSSSCHGL